MRLGATFRDQARGLDYRVNEISSSYHGIRLGAFIAYKPVPEWALRLFGEELAQSAQLRDRDLYGGNNGALVGCHVQRNF